MAGNNGFADSGSLTTLANAFSVFIDPTLDPDGDGLPNGLELLNGTDPYNADTDGDTFSDGVEVASRSDPLDPNSTPLNSRITGDSESLTFGIANRGFTSTMMGESDSIPVAVLNRGATSQIPIEVDSLTSGVLNTPSGASLLFESDSIPHSVCNTQGGAASCSGYSGLHIVSTLQGLGTPAPSVELNADT